MTESLKNQILQIPNEESWDYSTEESFLNAAKTMDEYNIPEDEILVMLSDLYWAVASEYGD